MNDEQTLVKRVAASIAFASMLFFQGCDFTQRRDPKDVPGQHNSSVWKVETNGTVNFAAYVSSSELPAGTKIKLKLIKEGDVASLRVIEWTSNGGKTLQEWSNEQIANGQIEDWTVPRPMRLGIEVGGGNYWRQATGSDTKGDLDELRFEGAWVVEVKIVPKEF